MRASVGLAFVSLMGAVGCSSLRFVDDDGESGGAALGGAPQGVGGGAATRSIEVAVELEGSFPADHVLVLVNAPDGALLHTLSGAELPTNVEVVDGDVVSFLSHDASSELHSFRVTPDVYRVAKQIGSDEPPTACNLEPMQLTVDVPSVAGAVGYEIATDSGALRDTTVPGVVTMDVTDCDGDGSIDLFAFAATGEALLSYELVEDIPFEPGADVSVTLSLTNTQRTTVDMQLSGLSNVQNVIASSAWRHVLDMEASEQTNGAYLEPTDEIVIWHSDVIDPGPGYGELDVTVSAQFFSGLGCRRRASIAHRGHNPPSSFDATRLAEVEPAGAQSWAFVEGEGEGGDVVWQSWRADPDDDFVWTTWEDASRPALEIVFPELPEALPQGFQLPTDDLKLHSLGNQDFLERPSYAESVATPGAETRQWRSARYDCGDAE